MITLSSAFVAMTFALSCVPKTAPEAAVPAVFDRTQPPAPLAPRPFALPAPQVDWLSNGIKVVLVENHETPLVWVQVVLNAGSWTDPDDQPGLASVTMDMLNEGAGDMDAMELSSVLREMASSLSTGAGLDGSSVRIKSLTRNLPATLDVMQTVLLEPTFPKSDWSLLQSKRVQGMRTARTDPSQMGSRVWRHRIHGAEYAGHLTQESAYEDIRVRDMKGWAKDHITPSRAIIMAGGAVTMPELVPLLEERFGSWQAETDSGASAELTATPPEVTESGVVYLADKPGAAQSVIRMGTRVGGRTDTDYAAFKLADRAFGGQFSARINMNLREDKGWTYGARSGSAHNRWPGVWSVRANVVTEHTADSMAEVQRELKEALSSRPITEDELNQARDGLLMSWPLSFEKPSYLLDETETMWLYDLPDDWLSGFIDRMSAVSLEQANAALANYLVPERMIWVVVGDAAVIRPGIEEMGLKVVMVDSDGLTVETAAEGG